MSLMYSAQSHLPCWGRGSPESTVRTLEEFWEQPCRVTESQAVRSLKPSSTTAYLLCDLEHVTQFLWALLAYKYANNSSTHLIGLWWEIIGIVHIRHLSIVYPQDTGEKWWLVNYYHQFWVVWQFLWNASMGINELIYGTWEALK